MRLLVLTVFAGLTAGVVLSALRMKPFGFVVKDGQLDRLMDFASHRAFACAAWAGKADDRHGESIYTLASHLRATERWSGLPASIALPFGYSPIMLWILGPFCMVPERAAFTAWVLAGVLVTVFVVHRADVHWRPLLVLITPLTVYAVALGQTAILSTAALLFLIGEDREAALPSVVSWKSAFVLWLLAAKPPLAVTAAAALLARGRWRTVVVAFLATAAATFVLLPWLAGGWVNDYIRLLAGYDQVHLPPAFAWSIVPESMSNLRGALHSDLGIGDDVAVTASGIAWGASLAALLATASRRTLDGGFIWSVALLAFLLLCPHVSATEDLALCCVLATMDHRGVSASSDYLVRGAVILVLVGLFLSPVMGPLAGQRPPAILFAKLALAGLFLAAPGLGRHATVAQCAR